MKKTLAVLACGLALIGGAQADEAASKEEVVSTVSGTMAAMAVAEGAKSCFYEAWMLVSGYDFKDKPELLKQVIAEQNIADPHKDLMLKGLSLDRASDPTVKLYFEECLLETENRVLNAVK